MKRHNSGLLKSALLNSAKVAIIGFLGIGSLMPWSPAAAEAPGGFMESVETTVTRPLLTPSQIADFMPSRGNFTFPEPYNTQGVRITNASDCGGQDCVDMIYSYWRNMSNSANSNIMYIFIGLDRDRGGAGPTLFSYNKTTGELTKRGPLFDASSPYSWASGEGWYFSYSMETKIYMTDGSKLMRYDVLDHTFETVFDTSSQFPNTIIRQTHSSNDDNVHSATLIDVNGYNTLGCVVYTSNTGELSFFPSTGGFDECQVDKSGRYLVIKQRTASTCSSCDVDNVIVDLKTGTKTMLPDMKGAGGHSALGYGWYVASDNWAADANTWRLWDLSQLFTLGMPLGVGNLLQGDVVYHNLDWSTSAPAHVSFTNARQDVPVSQQYACGASANEINAPHANEVICFSLDSSIPMASEQVLVVAPVMTDMNATGGNATCPGCESYAKSPKGNIDPTGQYFFWTSNHGGGRLDAFMVRIPGSSDKGAGPVTGGDNPSSSGVTITSPTSGASVSGTVTVSVDVSDDSNIASIQFQLDGTNLGAAITQPPYSISWDTSAAATGSHTLTAIAQDANGDTKAAPTVTVTTGSKSQPSGTGGTQPLRSGSGGMGLFGLALLCLLVSTARLRRSKSV